VNAEISYFQTTLSINCWALELPLVVYRRRVRIPLIVIAGSGIVISDSAHRDHAVGAKRR
jgi:hypothetical protein